LENHLPDVPAEFARFRTTQSTQRVDVRAAKAISMERAHIVDVEMISPQYQNKVDPAELAELLYGQFGPMEIKQYNINGGNVSFSKVSEYSSDTAVFPCRELLDVVITNNGNDIELVLEME